MAQRKRKRRFSWWWVLLGVLDWAIPTPIPTSWPTDLVEITSRAVSDATTLVYSIETRWDDAQVAAILRTLDDVNTNSCTTFMPVKNTVLTPGTGELRFGA